MVSEDLAIKTADHYIPSPQHVFFGFSVPLPSKIRSRSEITWPFVLLYCTASYAIWQPKTAKLFFDNGLVVAEFPFQLLQDSL